MTELDIKSCTLCPRECRADRTAGIGFCGEGDSVRIAKIMLHRWEEPCISGADPKRGSGAIFFSGCPLHCVYCQNREISGGGKGKLYTPKELCDEMRRLEDMGAYNINFVTPTHFIHKIIEALEIYRPSVPTVFNTGGYEKEETLKALAPYADIFLTDLKYFSAQTAQKYSNCPDYPSVALNALRVMVDITGKPRLDSEGMLKKGVILRHLILPGGRHDSKAVLSAAKDAVGCDSVILSLMSQYTPEFAPENEKVLKRGITSFEYNDVLDHAASLGFSGYGQDKSSATKAYTPDF